MLTKDHPARTLEPSSSPPSPWNRLGPRLQLAFQGRDERNFETTVHDVLDEGVQQNSLSTEERDMAESVLDLRKTTARELMTPRPRMTSLNLQDGEEENWRKVVSSGHSEFPVYDGNLDAIKGTVHIKTLWANLIGLGALLAGAFGMDVSGVDPQGSAEALTQAVAGIAFIASTLFRITASKALVAG